jgi:hypothetical protein
VFDARVVRAVPLALELFRVSDRALIERQGGEGACIARTCCSGDRRNGVPRTMLSTVTRKGSRTTMGVIYESGLGRLAVECARI